MFMNRVTSQQLKGLALLIFVAAALVLISKNWPQTAEQLIKAEINTTDPTDSQTPSLTMEELLAIAKSSLAQMETDLENYTARFEKVETSDSGTVSEVSNMELKVQTRFRNGDSQAARRIYMRFLDPESVRGREVIWREDKYDGKMAVHEIGFLVGLKTLWLDPNGLIAMAGQRHPISEVGLVKLTEQLIERGIKDLNNRNISISVNNDYQYDGASTRLITVVRDQPIEQPEDYQLAEIVMDKERQLVLAFRSFAKPQSNSSERRLIESYSYHELKTNVDLSESDFDVENANYGFP